MSTLVGPLQWKVVPMGAKNGDAAFHRMMEGLLSLVRDCADPCDDDITIELGTEDVPEDELIEAHERDMCQFLDVLDKHEMACKPTFVCEVESTGHVVVRGQQYPMPRKLAAPCHWKAPQTITELRLFMANWEKLPSDMPINMQKTMIHF